MNVLSFFIGALFLLLAGVAADCIHDELKDKDEGHWAGVVWHLLLVCVYSFTAYKYLTLHVLGTS